MRRIEEWLDDLGLGEYAPRFVENGIDLSVLAYLTDDDLKDLGVLLGHRRKLMANDCQSRLCSICSGSNGNRIFAANTRWH